MALNIRLRIIVAIQIAGSAYVAIKFLIASPGLGDGALVLLMYGSVLAISAFGLVSGLMIWAGKPFGYLGSVATHAIQIPMILTGPLAYQLSFGIGVFLNVLGPFNLVTVQFGGAAIFVLAPAQQGAALAINLYAVLALMYLIRDWKVLRSDQDRSSSDGTPN